MVAGLCLTSFLTCGLRGGTLSLWVVLPARLAQIMHYEALFCSNRSAVGRGCVRMLDHARPILIKRSRMVANSHFASGLAWGIAARTPCISQKAAVWRTSRT